MEFVDRTLKCSDCNADFIFTAGEQLFFADKQFKNDPKRCKHCKGRRSGQLRAIAPGTAPSLPLSRLETRTRCSSCGIDTTVPFKPTQGRPVLCRSCFQLKRIPAGVAAVANMDDAAAQVAAAAHALGLDDDSATVLPLTPAQAAMQAVEQTPGELLQARSEPPALELELAAALAPEA